MPVAEPYSAISLYSGAGGMDLGFTRAGFQMLWANDNDRFAVETYRRNLGDHAVCGDVLDTPVPPDLSPDIVIGGPPCQGFSVIGRMDPTDARSQHVFHFLSVVEQFKPRGFVMENVKALAASDRWAGTREALLEKARSLGYETKIFLLNAADYDVPQARERMFMVGLREGTPVPPRPVTAGSHPTVRDALAELPPFGETGNDGICTARVIPAARPVMRPTAFKGSLLFNGSGRPLHLDSPAKTLPASMSGNATPIIDQDELENGSRPWVVGYHQRLMRGGKPLRRAPKRMRRITVQEAAALQTFPSDWVFEGPQVARYRQIGNAVPSNLAYHLARAVWAALEAGQRTEAAAAGPSVVAA